MYNSCEFSVDWEQNYFFSFSLSLNHFKNVNIGIMYHIQLLFKKSYLSLTTHTKDM